MFRRGQWARRFALPTLLEAFDSKSNGLGATIRAFESSFDSNAMRLTDLCSSSSCCHHHECRDVACFMMQVYAAAHQPQKLRWMFRVVLRDLQPSLNATYFDTMLMCLLQLPQLSLSEVTFVLERMEEACVKRSVFTYLALCEIHLSLGVDPVALWKECAQRDLRPEDDIVNPAAVYDAIQPSTCLLKCIQHFSAARSKDVVFQMDVLRRLLKRTPVDRRHLMPIFLNFIHNPDAAPEHALWVLFELEQSCVFDKVPLREIVQRATLAQLLLKCAVGGDAVSAEGILAVMERHLMPKHHDILVLLLWSYARAEEIEKAFDTVEEMVRRSYLNNTDAFKKHTIECLSLPMEKHYLVLLAEALNSAALLDRAYFHLEKRKREGKPISIHSLDVIVLGCSKIGDVDRAVETMESYAALGLSPRTQSYNALLLGCIGRTRGDRHRTAFEAMLKNGIQPNGHTFRLLIRQAVTTDNIDEAFELIDKVSTFPGLRIEVEMLLPVLERAAKVGDIETVLRVMKIAVENDFGFDPNVLRKNSERLKEMGADASAVEQLVPIHDQLRNRTGGGRNR